MCVRAITRHGGGGASPGASPLDIVQYTQFQAQITAQRPIGVRSRVALTQAFVRSLPLPARSERTAAVALLFIVRAGAPGSLRERVRSYLRWSLSFGGSSVDVTRQARHARGQLRRAVGELNLRLQAHYALEPSSEGETLPALQRAVAQRAAEITYTQMLHAPDGLAPVHVQPMLDLLVSRPGSAALQITVERVAGDTDDAGDTRDAVVGAAAGGRRLRLGIVALGAAATPGALRLLARELRGHGALATSATTSATTSAATPKLKVFRPQSASERAHICHNLSAPAAEPWPHTTPPVEATITSADAALLLPLPFALFD